MYKVQSACKCSSIPTHHKAHIQELCEHWGGGGASKWAENGSLQDDFWKMRRDVSVSVREAK